MFLLGREDEAAGARISVRRGFLLAVTIVSCFEEIAPVASLVSWNVQLAAMYAESASS